MRKLLLICAAAGISCGGAAKTTEFSALCIGSQAAFWDLEVRCNQANPALLGASGFVGPTASGLGGSTASCEELRTAIAAGRIAYDAARGTACLAAAEALTCADLTPLGPALPASCSEAVAGAVANGAPCYLDAECADGSYCTATRTSSCPGTCQPKIALGGTCRENSTCTPGMQCFPSLPCAAGLVCGDRTCVTAGGLGSACPCQDAYWCDPSGGFPGTCRAPQTRGTCTFPVGPGSSGSPLGACATGYHCDFGTSECAPIAAAGGDCSASPMACGAGYGCPAGTCVSWPKLGEACEGLPCIGGYCDRGASPARCVPYKTTGCTAHAECASFSCGSDGNCAPVVYCAAP